MLNKISESESESIITVSIQLNALDFRITIITIIMFIDRLEVHNNIMVKMCNILGTYTTYILSC